MPRKRTLIDRMMNEVISYGGLPVTRALAYQHALVACSDIADKWARIHAAQRFAFLKPAIDATPLTYEQWVEITGEDFRAAA